MSIISVLIIGLALSMDAFGVSLALGINNGERATKNIIAFGGFQCVFAFLGGLFGNLFDTYIVSIPKIMGGIIIAFVGIIMIVEGKKENKAKLSEMKYMSIVLGISVSIDALVVGFTSLHRVGGISILYLDSICIGLITVLMCSIAFFVSKFLKNIDFISNYSELFGGIILICFGINMIIF